MNLFDLFRAELTLLGFLFAFLPLALVKKWRQQGHADGYTAITFIFPVMIMSCWCRHGWLTGDTTVLLHNGFNLLCFGLYLGLLVYYQRNRTTSMLQLGFFGAVLYALFAYVDLETDPTLRASRQATVAASVQICRLLGGVYELVRIFKKKTTEYVPAQIQFGLFALLSQWAVFAFLVGNYQLLIATSAGLTLNVITLSMYFIYPPLTWTVPIFNIAPVKKID